MYHSSSDRVFGNFQFPGTSFRPFRSVCTSLKIKSLHHFRERFFRKRKVFWIAEKLRELLDIVWDPYLGKEVRVLHIDATPRYVIRLWQLKVNIANNEQDDTIRSRLYVEYDIEYLKANELTRFWNETRYDQRTLVTVFEKLKSPGAGTFAYDSMDGKKYGKFGRRYCENSQNEMSRPFVSTMAAIATPGIAVREMLIDKARPFGAIGVGRLATLGPLLSRFDRAFENLQTFKISPRDWRIPEPSFGALLDKAPFAVPFLEKCINLRHLEISCFSMFETDVFPQMAQLCHYSHMQSCKLELFRLTAEDLLLFLVRAFGICHSIM
ncbi:hypothetical protein P154DRAFT_482774 [Amniculicola lignicola CBS 123094]|uniref:Uncharacterized protein n=1 Tax=Amniculicola lignicola CBS 123094 TaxID=1392246 RepID=A0A6A5WWN8_9PLEO|nr:hypothetical protein P154DRAFT_482774 [Amniculicola lignicola CBS 123094]